MKTKANTLTPPAHVTAVYDTLPNDVRGQMLLLRGYIFEEAARNLAVGAITETLKWNEPAYLTEETKSGTTVRLAWKDKKPQQFALLVNCQTSLVAPYKDVYGSVLSFEGTRAIIFERGAPLPEDAIRHCISMAQTYHLNT